MIKNQQTPMLNARPSEDVDFGQLLLAKEKQDNSLHLSFSLVGFLPRNCMQQGIDSHCVFSLVAFLMNKIFDYRTNYGEFIII